MATTERFDSSGFQWIPVNPSEVSSLQIAQWKKYQ
jgi:hypothetical protein